MAETSSSRRRVRAGLLAGVLVVVVVGGGGWVVARGGLLGGSAAATPTPEVPTGTATVARTNVVERQQVAGTLGYGDSVTVPGQSQGGGGSSGGGSGAGEGGQARGGIVTRVPVVGAVVGRGQALYELDGHPVPLWYGGRPAWRAFQPGMADGSDVRQLEANLVALGYDPDRAITVDRHYSWATAAAVKRWQQASGRARTGAVPLGEVVFVPGPIRVATVSATVGAPLAVGTAILSVSSTRPLVTVDLDPALQWLVRRGDRVGVVLPDGKTTGGTVRAVSRVATQPSTGSTGSGQNEGQGGSGSGSGSGQATVQVTIRLANPKAAANLDQAPVQVAITTQAARGVLAVPISALLAQPGGGYAVQVLQGGSTSRWVAVRTGLFDETAGLVEVAGAGLAEGATVEVPAP